MEDEEFYSLWFEDSDDDSVFEGYDVSELREVRAVESDLDIDFENLEVSPVSTPEVSSDEETEEPRDLGAWSARTSPINVSKFEQFVGAEHDLEVGASPFDYFSLFIPNQFYKIVRDETNRYADQRQAQTGKEDTKWKPVTEEEVKLYFAIGIMMGIIKLPRQRSYWANDDRLNIPSVSKLMSQNRFEKISQYLHLNDNTQQVPRGQEGFDPLFKVRPLINMTSASFKQHFKPPRELSIDEAMVSYSGRLHFKQYIKGKPTPWGIKIWCCADPKTGYLLTYDVYTGKTVHTEPGGLGHHVVVKLAEEYLEKNHHLFFDNYFNSVALQEDLLRKKTYACGTIRVNRKHWPKDLVFSQRTPKAQRPKKGETRMRQRGDMVATVWQDKRMVTVLSTGVQPTMGTALRRGDGGRRVEKEIPTPVLAYNASMGGVDLFDQRRSYYTMGRQSRKWWRYLLWFLLETAMINAGILYKFCNLPRPKNCKFHDAMYFRLAVYDELIKNNVHTRRQQQQPASFLGQAISDPLEHQVVKMTGRAKNCVLCQKEGRRTAKGRGVQSTFGCVLCKVNLCKGLCFAQFHAQLVQ